MRYVKEYRLMLGPRLDQYGESARADLLQRIHAIVNVTDGPESSLTEIPGVQQFWIPINELGVWDYTSHYALKRCSILWWREVVGSTCAAMRALSVRR